MWIRKRKSRKSWSINANRKKVRLNTERRIASEAEFEEEVRLSVCGEKRTVGRDSLAGYQGNNLIAKNTPIKSLAF